MMCLALITRDSGLYTESLTGSVALLYYGLGSKAISIVWRNMEVSIDGKMYGVMAYK